MINASATTEFDIEIDPTIGSVSALTTLPEDPLAVYAFAHGAGAGMRHSFMESVSAALVKRKIAVVRYQFPYMEAGRRAPNPPRILKATVNRSLDFVSREFESLPMFAGGKSMGGRMTSMCMAESPRDRLKGLIFFGFPLHAAGKPSSVRGQHLQQIAVPMLFVQGSRDRLANLSLLQGVIEGSQGRGDLMVVDQGDHSLRVPKRTGRTYEQVLEQVTEGVAEWIVRHIDSPPSPAGPSNRLPGSDLP